MSTPGTSDLTDPSVRREWWPSLLGVAALVRARTRVRSEREQRELGRFADIGDPEALGGTRPTATEAEEFVRAAVLELIAGSGGVLPCSPGLRSAAGTFAKYRAAQLVELSLTPEASSSADTVAESYGRLADGLIERLSVAIPKTCAPPATDPGAGVTRLSAAGVVPCRTRTGFRDPRGW